MTRTITPASKTNIGERKINFDYARALKVKMEITNQLKELQQNNSERDKKDILINKIFPEIIEADPFFGDILKEIKNQYEKNEQNDNEKKENSKIIKMEEQIAKLEGNIKEITTKLENNFVGENRTRRQMKEITHLYEENMKLKKFSKKFIRQAKQKQNIIPKLELSKLDATEGNSIGNTLEESASLSENLSSEYILADETLQSNPNISHDPPNESRDKTLMTIEIT